MQVNGDPSQNRTPSAQAPIGSHIARVLFIIDLGTQESSFPGKPVEYKKKVQVGFELVNTTKPSNPGEPQMPFTLSKEYTQTFTGSKSKLRQMYNAIMGGAMSDEEAKIGKDISVMLNRECVVGVIAYTKGDGTQGSKIDTVMAPMAGVPVPNVRNEIIYFSIGNPNQFDLLPKIYKWIRESVSKSPEFNAECQKIGITPAIALAQAEAAWKAANPLPNQQGGQQQPAMQPNQQWAQQPSQQQQYGQQQPGYNQQASNYQQQPAYNQQQPAYQPPPPQQQGFQQQPPYQQPQGQPYQQPAPYPNQQPAQYPNQPVQQQPVPNQQRTMNPNPQPIPPQQQQQGFGQQQAPPQPGFGSIVTEGHNPL